MKYQIIGKVVDKLAVEEFASGFRKQSVVVDTAYEGSNWPCPVSFTFKKDNIELQAGKVNVGDQVNVTYVLEGRKWEKDGQVKYFNDIVGLEVEVTKAAEVGEKPKTAGSWKELQGLAKAWGYGEDKLKDKCKSIGKPFAEMKESDWQWVAAEIVVEMERAQSLPTDSKTDEADDDIPF